MDAVTDAAVGIPAPTATPARPAGRTIVAVLVVAVAWIPALAALSIALATGLSIAGPDDFLLLYLLNAFVWGGASGLLLARRPNVIGVVLAVLAIGSGLSALNTPFAAGVLTGIDPGLSVHILDRLWLPGTLAALAVLPLLMTERPLPRALRAAVGLGFVAAVLPVLAAIIRQRPGFAPNPLAIDDPVVQSISVAVFTGSLAIEVALAITTLVVLLVRWRRGPVRERTGAGWLAIGQALLVVFFTPMFLPTLPEPAYFLGKWAPLGPVLALVFMVSAVLVASLGQGLLGIEVAFNRVVAEVLLFGVLVLLYASIAVPAAQLLPVPPMIAGVAGVAALALALEPLRAWVQRRVDALVYGDAADPAQLLARLGGAADGRDVDGLAELVAELRATLRLSALEVTSADADGPAVAVGTPAGPVTRLPLRNSAATIGWVAASSAGRQRVDRRTRQVLERIAGVLAIALQLEEANRDAAEARDRALGVRDEEWRMVRRELLERLTPTLEATGDRLATVRRHIATQPAAARRELARVREDIAVRTAEVRDLARTLVPGALDAGDLATAIAELAARFSSGALAIEAKSRGADELDTTRQVAVHHIAADAVLLLRRSTARRGRVSVDVEDREVVVTIAADAPFAVGPRAAATVDSIRARADELEGRVEVSAGGDELRAAVPR